MSMRSLFFKHYFAYACLIVLSFTIAGVNFHLQVNLYSVTQRQNELNKTVDRIMEMTNVLLRSYTKEIQIFYELNLHQASEDSGCSIIVSDRMGRIIFSVGNQNTIKGYTIDPEILSYIKEHGSYSEQGNFGMLFEEQNFVLGRVLQDTYGFANVMIFVATPAHEEAELFSNIINIFLVILLVTLLFTLLISYFITGRMTKSLKIMALAARGFARGNFSVRVPEDNNCNEIDELAISFNRMAFSLEQVEELSGGFIANVSHELKTPMTSISGFVDGIIDKTIPKEKEGEYLAIVSEEIKRLSRLVTRMLDAAKIQSGDLTIIKSQFDFCEMASRIILSFENVINDKKIAVNIDFADRLMIEADRDRLFQAVYNLVDNAVKFTPDGGYLNLKTKKHGSSLFFSIINSGDTISDKDASLIFNRFYKVDTSRGKDKSGAGLGLYIVKTIINLHSGDISVKSANGETQFSFEIPGAK